jgi:hypothetical protein
MPRNPDPNSQRAVAEFFGLRPDRFCRLLQRHGIDYKDRAAVAEMLRRSSAMSPQTRAAVDAVLGTPAPLPSPDSLETLESIANAPAPSCATVEEAELYLANLKRNLATAERTSEELRKLGQFEDARRWLALASTLGKSYPALHKKVLELKQEHKELIRCDDAQRTFSVFLHRMRDLAERMPAGLSGRVSPHDPEGAREQLLIWVRDVFCKSLNQHPVVTP